MIFFSKRLIIPEYFVTELGQNHVPPTSDSIILNDKNHFWAKPLDKLLTKSLWSKFETIIDKNNLDNKLSQIGIVKGGDHGQGKCRSVDKFIIRGEEGYDKESYVIKKWSYILHQRCIYDILAYNCNSN